jgi:putative ATPase
VYPHDLPEGIVTQQYAPDVIDGRAYYEPSSHGMEGRFAERARLIRAILHSEQEAGQPAGGPDNQGTGSQGTANQGTRDEGTTE